jgi:hypothetical protein
MSISRYSSRFVFWSYLSDGQLALSSAMIYLLPSICRYEFISLLQPSIKPLQQLLERGGRSLLRLQSATVSLSCFFSCNVHVTSCDDGRNDHQTMAYESNYANDLQIVYRIKMTNATRAMQQPTLF